jgi:hypothetical protein
VFYIARMQTNIAEVARTTNKVDRPAPERDRLQHDCPVTCVIAQ